MLKYYITDSGVLAAREFKKGEIVGKLLKKTNETGNKYKDYVKTNLGQYTQNSLKPNVTMTVDQKTGDIYIRALKNITTYESLKVNFKQLPEPSAKNNESTNKTYKKNDFDNAGENEISKDLPGTNWGQPKSAGAPG